MDSHHRTPKTHVSGQAAASRTRRRAVAASFGIARNRLYGLVRTLTLVTTLSYLQDGRKAVTFIVASFPGVPLARKYV